MRKRATALRLLLILGVLSALVFAPTVYSQGNLSVTVSTDKPQYTQSETVQISGKVLDQQNNPISGASVSIQVGDPPIHVGLLFSDNSGSYVDAFPVPATASGQYTVYATASKPGYTSAQQQTQFSVILQNSSTTSNTVTSTSSSSQSGSKCFIATATYGSEISPEVALLRNFRDADVLRTSAGSNFMMAFNAFYYSFSPQVATFIASHNAARMVMKGFLYPMIGTLYVSSRMFEVLWFNSELAVVVSGIFTALVIGAVYLGPLVLVGRRLLGSRIALRRSSSRLVVLGCCTVSMLILAFAEVGGYPVFLMIASVASVLSFLLLGAFSGLYLELLLANWYRSVCQTKSFSA